MTTIKGFVNKATGNVSATAFLAAHREFLTKGAVGAAVAPILAKLDAGATYPTPALGEICKVLMDLAISADIAKGEAAMAAEPATTAPFTGVVYDDRGEVAVAVNAEGEERPMVQGFPAFSKAEGWCDRRLVADGGPGWKAVVRDNRTGRETPVDRDHAFGRVERRSPSTVTTSNKPAKGFSWGMKVRESHHNFSKG